MFNFMARAREQAELDELIRAFGFTVAVAPDTTTRPIRPAWYQGTPHGRSGSHAGRTDGEPLRRRGRGLVMHELAMHPGWQAHFVPNTNELARVAYALEAHAAAGRSGG